MMSESWLDVPGYEGLYQVSDLGRVKSLQREVWNGVAMLKIRERVLSPRPHPKSGHTYVQLCKDGNKKNVTIHSVVMLAFVGPRTDGMEICHWDGNPANNILNNLRYDTCTANKADAIRHGTLRHGENHYASKLSDNQVIEIRERRANGEVAADLAREYGVSSGLITTICKGKSWKHVAGPLSQVMLSEQEVIEIRERRAAGERMDDIAKLFDVTKGTISKICIGAIWPNTPGPITRSYYRSDNKKPHPNHGQDQCAAA